MRTLALLGLLVSACARQPEPAHLEPAHAGAEPHDHGHAQSAAVAAGGRFGQPVDPSLPLTPLASIVAEPERFADRVVRTQGEVARVCQRMGCWMELRERPEAPGVRVPMAGHSFFLPRDSAGRHATLQGRVTLQPLSPEARAHLESEGAVATASALSIEATGVVLD